MASTDSARKRRRESFVSSQPSKRNNSALNWEELQWSIPKKYFIDESTGERHRDVLVKHHKSSFNYFCSEGIENVFRLRGSRYRYDEATGTRYEASLSNPKLESPSISVNEPHCRTLLPHETRMRNISYCCNLYADVRVRILEASGSELFNESLNQMYVGSIPCMLQSKHCNLYGMTKQQLISAGECELDGGGYFIVNGGEKVFVTQENSFGLPTQVRVASCGRICAKAYKWTSCYLQQNNSRAAVKIVIPVNRRSGSTKLQLPIMLVLMALGIQSFDTVLPHIFHLPKVYGLLKCCAEDVPSDVRDKQTALKTISNLLGCADETEDSSLQNSAESYAENMLLRLLFPCYNQRTTDDQISWKAMALGYMMERLITVSLQLDGSTKIKGDDIDHYGSKRADTAGVMLTTIMYSCINMLLSTALTRLIKHWKSNRWSSDASEGIELSRYFDEKIITKTMNTAIGTGAIKKMNGKIMKGVSQALDNKTYASKMAHLRRLRNPLPTKGVKLSRARQFHDSGVGFVCPLSTPEGENCGLDNNFALLTKLSKQRDVDTLFQLLKDKDIFVEERGDGSSVRFFVNGIWRGICTHGYSESLRALRQLKINGTFWYDVAIFGVQQDWRLEVHVRCDAGRLIRPLIRYPLPEQDISDCSWKELLYRGYIEYVDPNEQDSPETVIQTDLTAPPDPAYSHCELHPSFWLSIIAASPPYANLNPTTRILYQSNMGKQGITLPALNVSKKFDAVQEVLWYPQKPLVTTKCSELSGMNEVPPGQNYIVAIAYNMGYNQEDSLIMSQKSIDLGLGRSTKYKTYTDIENAGNGERIGGTQLLSYSSRKYSSLQCMKLEDDGLPEIGTKIVDGDPIISKTIQQASGSIKDVSTVFRSNMAGETSVVDAVACTTTIRKDETHKLCKVRLRITRVPQIGDKFSSRHGQKGTIGIVLPPEDMPWIMTGRSHGMTPDAIINPHAIPSRMTLGHLMEMLAGKVAAQNWTIADATAFTTSEAITLSSVSAALKALGMESTGLETMADGRTGQPFQAQIFTGPICYQKLTHQVNDKVNARGRGSMNSLTGQPGGGGKSRGGALRLGEMERDCLLAYGVSEIVTERLFDNSDGIHLPVCRSCGWIGMQSIKKGEHVIYRCSGKHCPDDSVVVAKTGTAWKVCCETLISLGIRPRLIVE